MLRIISRLAAVAMAAAVVAAVGPRARASDISDYASRADSLLAAGKADQALTAFGQAVAAFWQASPLQFRTATFVTWADGFGQYQPRTDAKFHPGETATVYVAPVGYGFTQTGDWLNVEMTTGLEILTPGGIILARTDDYGKLSWRGRTPSYQVHASIAITLPRLKPGNYVLKLTLADRASAKSASTTVPFTIVE